MVESGKITERRGIGLSRKGFWGSWDCANLSIQVKDNAPWPFFSSSCPYVIGSSTLPCLNVMQLEGSASPTEEELSFLQNK